MAEELRELRISRKIPAKRMVEVIQRFHPKFDKTMLSKCEHGTYYGVRIRRDALDTLYREFAPDLLPSAKKERDGHHRLTKRISCRLKDAKYAALLQAIQEDGYLTVQAWLSSFVDQYLENRMQLSKGVYQNDQRP